MFQDTTEQATTSPLTPGPREARPPPARVRRPPAARVALVQGIYYAATGIWPILDHESFMGVTGPKLDGRLVKTIGMVVTGVGVALAAAGARGRVARELRVLGVTTALGFAAINFWYGGVRRRISRVYLADGLAELGLAAAWAHAAWRERHDARRLPEAAFA